MAGLVLWTNAAGALSAEPGIGARDSPVELSRTGSLLQLQAADQASGTTYQMLAAEAAQIAKVDTRRGPWPVALPAMPDPLVREFGFAYVTFIFQNLGDEPFYGHPVIAIPEVGFRRSFDVAECWGPASLGDPDVVSNTLDPECEGNGLVWFQFFGHDDMASWPDEVTLETYFVDHTGDRSPVGQESRAVARVFDTIADLPCADGLDFYYTASAKSVDRDHDVPYHVYGFCNAQPSPQTFTMSKSDVWTGRPLVSTGVGNGVTPIPTPVEIFSLCANCYAIVGAVVEDPTIFRSHPSDTDVWPLWRIESEGATRFTFGDPVSRER